MFTPDYHYAVFDMDGTLLDSMHCWRDFAEEYLITHGQTQEAARLQDSLRKMSCISGIRFIHDLCVQVGIPPATIQDLYDSLGRHYVSDVQLKPGTLQFLQGLQRRGIRMCIATATPHYLVEMALEHAGLRSFFEFVVTPEDCPAGKKDPAFFQLIFDRFGCVPEDTALFEDALYSIRTGAALGMYCVGVADRYSQHEESEIRKLVREFHMQWPAI